MTITELYLGLYQTSNKGTFCVNSLEAATEVFCKKGVLCSVKKVFCKTPVPESKSHLSLRPTTLLKKRVWHRCFPVNFAKFLRKPFLQNTSGRLLLTDMCHSMFSNLGDNGCSERLPTFSKYIIDIVSN